MKGNLGQVKSGSSLHFFVAQLCLEWCDVESLLYSWSNSPKHLCCRLVCQVMSHTAAESKNSFLSYNETALMKVVRKQPRLQVPGSALVYCQSLLSCHWQLLL